jgi:hydroxymethylpyrimidine/phosphomethylpyrimidine kinase
MKTALTIAGSDPSGCTGAQADLKTFTELGTYWIAVITTVTVQNTTGVKESSELDAQLVARQIDAAAGDIQVDACKTGMLANVEIVEAVEDAIGRNQLQPYVLDPVMTSHTGGVVLHADAVAAIKKKLFPRATVVTPNLAETAELVGVEEIQPTVPSAKDAAKRMVGLGAKAVVIKGLPVNDQTVDLFFDGREFLEFVGNTQPKEKSHGAGSAFSAAITAGLANRLSLVDAIDQAKNLVTMAIQYSDGQGRGTAPVNVLAFAPKKK